jgi:2-polyprenyl-3-methyl-5-hydroxy-6-metoxy-1,4-benzoquinol methylase
MQEKKTAQFFDRYSQDFSSIYGTRSNMLMRIVDKVFRKSMLLRFVRTLQECLPAEGKTALDVGCGPGHYGIALARQGLCEVVGIDFAEKMITLAREQATANGLERICRFEVADFFALDEAKHYDYLILMGFMDYIREPETAIRKAMQLANAKVLFSFPAAGGILAWQRKIRYRTKCPLFLYTEKQIHNLFGDINPWSYELERIDRDYFITMFRKA